MEHYFSHIPTSESNPGLFEYKLEGIEEKKLSFITDSGIFSREKVDFGSNLLIKSLPCLSGEVLDIGCGYGPIGISIAYLCPEAYVTMTDINTRAIILTQKNILKNHITNAKTLLSDGFENVKENYQTIVCNPPIRAGKKVIYPIFEKSIEYLFSNGSLYIVIQRKQGAPTAREKLKKIFSNCEVITKESGYWILRSIKESD